MSDKQPVYCPHCKPILMPAYRVSFLWDEKKQCMVSTFWCQHKGREHAFPIENKRDKNER